ncbi:hypothetical protein [Propionispora vibrioides]|uniref:Uncharacterized protein n=1 Tax=Propionispora vibrioides TaxID=112903 RepID=A0A1H8U5J0_9FIRM|nr:hypothetical protein [Propionispora vibrioides]SEO97908.1 hypothetical protein SAMN04490178_10822 [Propionispora vibrioides]
MDKVLNLTLTKSEINTIYEALKEFKCCIIEDYHMKNIETIIEKMNALKSGDFPSKVHF